ncbi:hypothetical protein HDU76_007542 [Blyttiomyces sp. JEL0837]|nr:hypothetical protein HDU76_007542 [Blyttiomyces sp. JEL0837]
MSRNTFSFPDYLLPNILCFLEPGIDNTLNQMRLVSKTWRDFIDHVFFRKIIVLRCDNIDLFLDWIAMPSSAAVGDNSEPITNPRNAVSTPTLTPKCRNVLQYIDYVEIHYPSWSEYNFEFDDNKFITALKAIPNLKGIMYGSEYNMSSSQLMKVYHQLLERKSTVTHLEVTCAFLDIADVPTTYLFGNGTWSNLRFLKLNLSEHEFDLGLLKNLVAIDTMVVESASISLHMVDMMGMLPKTLRRLKLWVSRMYAFQCTTFQPQHNNSHQMTNLNILEVGFFHMLDDTVAESVTIETITKIQQLFSWLTPNLKELKLNGVTVMQENGTTDFLNIAFAALAWDMVRSNNYPYQFLHLIRVYHHIVHYNFHSTFQSHGEIKRIMAALLEKQPYFRMPSLTSMTFGELSGQHEQILRRMRSKVLERYSGGVEHIYLYRGVVSWNDIMTVWRESGMDGTPFPGLKVVTFLRDRFQTTGVKDNVRVLVTGKEDKANEFIQKFVDSLPETVVEIRVGVRVFFEEWDVTDVLVRVGRLRGITVGVGKFCNPFEMYEYPLGLRDL